MSSIDAYRDEQGKLASYAWPGGYPMCYLDEEGNTLCPDCANKEDMSTTVVAGDANWEDPMLFCDDCSCRIESAYAEEEEHSPHPRGPTIAEQDTTHTVW